MSDKKRYIDQAGLKFFYTNLKKVFRTEAQVTAQINNALSAYRADADISGDVPDVPAGLLAGQRRILQNDRHGMYGSDICRSPDELLG